MVVVEDPAEAPAEASAEAPAEVPAEAPVVLMGKGRGFVRIIIVF